MKTTQSVSALLLGASLTMTAPALTHANNQAGMGEATGNSNFEQFKPDQAARTEWI